MSQQVSALNYVLNSFEEATKKDFKGFTLERSSTIYNAFQELQSQLLQGAKAVKELEDLKDQAKGAKAVENVVQDENPSPKITPKKR